jgi:hypothetical protein
MQAVTDCVYLLASVVTRVYGLGAQPKGTRSLRQSEATSDLPLQRGWASPDFPRSPAVDIMLHLVSDLVSWKNQ